MTDAQKAELRERINNLKSFGQDYQLRLLLDLLFDILETMDSRIDDL